MEATEQLTLFTEAFLNDGLVKTFLAPANRPVSPAIVPDSGTKCSGWSGKYGPVGSWLKTYVERSISPSISFAPVWRMKDTSSGRSCFLLLRLERRTEENGCSSSRQERMWPTARAIDCKGASMKRVMNANGKATGSFQLREAVFVCGRRRTGTVPTEPESTATEGRISRLR